MLEVKATESHLVLAKTTVSIILTVLALACTLLGAAISIGFQRGTELQRISTLEAATKDLIAFTKESQQDRADIRAELAASNEAVRSISLRLAEMNNNQQKMLEYLMSRQEQ
jgi:hypothetical protein